VLSEPSLQRAIYSINVSIGAFVVGDVFVKILGRTYPLGEVIFWRSCIIAVAIGIFLLVRDGLSIRNLLTVPVLARSAFDCINIFSFVSAIVHMKIAELYTIALTSPFLITILAVIFLKEQIGWRRWLAIGLGFFGALLIIKPDTHAFNYWAAVGLVAAISAAARELITQKIDPATSTFEVSLSSAIFAAGAAWLFGTGESWMPMTIHEVTFLIVMTAAWVAGGLLLIYACRVGPLSIVASFRYMFLVWGSLAGYFVFGDLPDIWSVFGAAIIVSCGSYMFYRETVRRRALTSRVTTIN
jgi:drug/metabolite transporter (DMT)-like permease